MQRDPWDIPSICLWSAFLVAALSPWVYRKARQYRSRNWPRTKAVMEGASLRFHPRGPRYTLDVPFKYFVDGSEHFGFYTHDFRFRDEAEHALKNFESGTPFVRYSPARPERYFIDPYADLS